MAGECVEFRVNYDKLPSFIENSLGQAKFWQILAQFVETLQVGQHWSHCVPFLINIVEFGGQPKITGTIKYNCACAAHLARIIQYWMRKW